MAFRFLSRAALTASCLLASLAAAETTNTMLMSTPTATPTNIRALTSIGCFATTVPMVNHGPYIYQTSGNCQQICLLFGNTAMGLGNGTDCWCGDAYPPQNTKVDDGQCDTSCAGYGIDKCGGANALTVFGTGLTLNAVPFWVVSSSSITSAPVATMTASPSSTPKSSGGSSMVGIVVGVIVGIVVLGGLAGVAFLYFRRKQQDMVDYKHQNDVSSFVGTKTDQNRPQMWAPDNRLDTSAGRRLSSGSIADNQDYSRRILQVRNPDGNGF